jgi:hypothetical protein
MKSHASQACAGCYGCIGIQAIDITYLASLCQCIRILDTIHASLCCERIRASQHLDESVAFVLVDDAALDFAELTEYASNLRLTPSSTAYEKRAAINLDVVTGKCAVPVYEFRRPILVRLRVIATTTSSRRRRRTLTIFIRVITTTAVPTSTAATITTILAVHCVAIRACIWIVYSISWTIAPCWRGSTRRLAALVVFRGAATIPESTAILFKSIWLCTILYMRRLQGSCRLRRRNGKASILSRSQHVQYLQSLFLANSTGLPFQ